MFEGPKSEQDANKKETILRFQQLLALQVPNLGGTGITGLVHTAEASTQLEQLIAAWIPAMRDEASPKGIKALPAGEAIHRLDSESLLLRLRKY